MLSLTRPSARTVLSVTLVLTLGIGVAGCSPDGAAPSALASCDEVIPKELAADILGRADGELVQLDNTEPDPVSPVVDRMVTDGIACGGSANGVAVLDGAVMIGQLQTTEADWESIQADFAADGHEADVDIGIDGWVYVAKPSDDPMLGSGFAWRDGVLYYLVNPMLLAFVPAFADEFAAES